MHAYIHWGHPKMQTHMHAHEHAHASATTCTYACTYTCARACTHTHPYACKHTYAHFKRTFTRTLICAWTCGQKYMSLRMCRYAFMYTRTTRICAGDRPPSLAFGGAVLQDTRRISARMSETRRRTAMFRCPVRPAGRPTPVPARRPRAPMPRFACALPRPCAVIALAERRWHSEKTLAGELSECARVDAMTPCLGKGSGDGPRRTRALGARCGPLDKTSLKNAREGRRRRLYR